MTEGAWREHAAAAVTPRMTAAGRPAARHATRVVWDRRADCLIVVAAPIHAPRSSWRRGGQAGPATVA